MSSTFRQTTVESLYARPETKMFVSAVFMYQYKNQLQHLPFFTETVCPVMLGHMRGMIVPGYILSTISPNTLDVVLPIYNMMGRLRVTLANVDRYHGQFKQALGHVKGRLGLDPFNDRLRWVSIKIIAEEKLPDIIGTIVTLEGVDLGRELVDLNLMEKYDPSRHTYALPQIPLMQGVYAHEEDLSSSRMIDQPPIYAQDKASSQIVQTDSE